MHINFDVPGQYLSKNILCGYKLPTSQNKDHVPKCTFYNPILCVFHEKALLQNVGVVH